MTLTIRSPSSRSTRSSMSPMIASTPPPPPPPAAITKTKLLVANKDTVTTTVPSTTANRRLVLSFLAGFVAAAIVTSRINGGAKNASSSSSSWLSSSLKGARRSSSNCEISFGEYKGGEYTTAKGGTVGRPRCLVESKFMKLQLHQVRMPPESDNVIPDWLWIDYHDRINVLVQAPPEATASSSERQVQREQLELQQQQQHQPRFLVFEQTKYALEGRMSLAIVGGIIEPGEEPEHAAAREVEEEMKVRCDQFHFLGRFRTDVNRGAGWTNSFLATRCSPAATAFRGEEGRTSSSAAAAKKASSKEEVGVADTERQDLKTLSLEELKEATRDGRFLEIQWSATVALSLLHPELTGEEHNGKDL